MKTLLASVIVLFSPAAFSQEVYRINVNKFCAAAVDIPYASDNFSEDEWILFQQCLKYMRQFKVK